MDCKCPESCKIVHMAGKKGRSGPKSTYTSLIAGEILERLAAGESLLDICRDDHMPAESTVRGWVVDDREGFAALYARARDIGLDHEADEIKRIADTPAVGDKVEKRHVAWVCVACGGEVEWSGSRWTHCAEDSVCDSQAKPDQITEDKTTTGDMIEHRRLQIDARKWRLSKMAPKRYGDKSALDHRLVDGEGKDRAMTMRDMDAIVASAD